MSVAEVRTFVVGDVQGCFAELQRLLEKLSLRDTDEVWFVGDLINRGPQSLEMLRFARSQGERFRTVLGNHDLHFLAIYFGGHSPKRSDTMEALLAAPDVDELAHWLRRQPLLLEHADAMVVHAGVYPLWSQQQASAYAEEVSAVLRSDNYVDFFRAMYGNEPDGWSEDLAGLDRLRFITNVFTRMRLLHEDLRLDFAHKGPLDEAPAHLRPWYDLRAAHFPHERVVFGHWAALEGHTGLANTIAVDTGCVWGRSMTAYCLETGEQTSQNALS